jgi:hypothetical protein
VDAGDGFYHVRIRAKVGQGQPGWNDVLALRQLVRMKQSPRIALDLDELVEGLPPHPGFAKAWFESAADQLQLKLVDLPSAARLQDRYAARDDFFGDARTADYRRAGLTQQIDFVIQARLRGRYLGAERLYGSLPRHRFSLTADLRAFRPDSDGILAVSLPGRDRLESTLDAAPDAARELVMAYLAGDPNRNDEGAWALFRRIFAQWITELDLGAIFKIELAGISKAEYDALRAALAGQPEITSVWPREFDARGISSIDAEARMDAASLGAAVERLSGHAFAVDQHSAHAIQLRRSAPAAARDHSAPGPDAPPAGGGIPGWLWALGGAAAVGVVGGAFALGRKSTPAAPPPAP